MPVRGMTMGARKTAVLAIAVIAILLIVQISAVVGASKDDEKPEIELRVHYLYVSDVKPDNPGNGHGNHGGGGDEATGSYKLLSKGAYWKTLPIKIVIDADGSGMSDGDVASAIWAGATAWDAETSTYLFHSYSSGDASFDYTTRDTYNEMVFGDFAEANVIAVTYTWGIFTGSPSNRKIVEFDIMFDTDYNWGDADSDPSAMDLQNIATHEIGHGLGLADLYNDADSDQTMYGYADYGETDKRSLESGDIAGIQALYGT